VDFQLAGRSSYGRADTRLGIPIELIAEFPCRNIDEVQAKIAERGLNPTSEPPPA
jgi:hypothetical protein